MNLKQMKYFLTIADEGSISRAARGAAYFSAAPVSAASPAGGGAAGPAFCAWGAEHDADGRRQASVSACPEYSGTFGQGCERSSAVEDDGRGSLRIGMVSSSEVPYVLERIRPFRDRYPRWSFRSMRGNTYQLLDWMKEDRVELAFVRTPFAEDGFECLFLEEETMAAWENRNFSEGDSRKRLPCRS